MMRAIRRVVPFYLFIGFFIIIKASAQPAFYFSNISSRQGLSQNSVNCILKDKYGLMWIGTQDGLNKYDGYEFTIYKRVVNDPKSIAANNIYGLCEDSEGNLWVATRNGGVSVYNRNTESFTNYGHDKNDSTSLSSNHTYFIYEDKGRNLWIATMAGLNLFDKKTKKFKRYVADPNDNTSLSSDKIFALLEDRKGNFWIGTGQGLNLLDRQTGKCKHYLNDPTDPKSLANNSINKIVEDNQGNLWLGTTTTLELFQPQTETFEHFETSLVNNNGKSGGAIYGMATDGDFLWIGAKTLSLFDIKKKSYVDYIAHSNGEKNMKDFEIYSLLLDDRNILWVGTTPCGIYKYDRNLSRFSHHKLDHHLSTFNVIWSFEEDSKGNIYIGTRAGLSYFNRKTNSYTYYTHDSQDKNSISGQSIYALLIGRENDVWVGSNDGLDIFDPETKTFQHFSKGDGPLNISSNLIRNFCEDSKGNIWIATGRGVNMYNKEKKSFIQYVKDPENTNSPSDNSIEFIMEDRQNNIWIGSRSGGIDVLNPDTQQFTHYNTENSNISDDVISHIYEDSRGNVWIGTMEGGLNRFNKTTNDFTAFTEQQGLVNNTVYAIVEDDLGFLWLSTNRGIVRFDTEHEKFRNYTVLNGLQDEEFNIRACFNTKSGEILFGGINGFNIFKPSLLSENKNIPATMFTGFELFNKSVAINDDHSVLKQSLANTKEITLSHDQSVFTFKFAALDYTLPEKNEYAYKLEGFDKDWNYVGGQRKATYTNLNPGEYIFKVKASNNEGLWNEEDTSLNVTITPPYWLTWWFITLWIVFVAGSLFAFFAMRLRMIRRQRLALERQVKERTEQLAHSTEEERKARHEAEKANQAKSIFLATMSHEIRTPMNGVIGMASLLAETTQSSEQQEYTETIKTCGESLLTVINDILDYSKIESGKMEFESKDFDLRTCVEEVLDVFATKAVSAGLDLIYQIDCNVPQQIIGDSLRLRQVLLNLVGNAIKFTEKGEIFIGVHLLHASDNQVELKFDVRDTGIGIPADKLERLFKAFTQIDSSTTRKYGGTGLGLAISEKLIHLMGGTVAVESQVGIGTTFSFTFRTAISQQSSRTYVQHNTAGLEGKKILVVDDNLTNRNILKTQLEHWKFIPVMATSGKQALDVLSQTNDFDLVLTDMQMPEMDGKELGTLIRQSHPGIPIILLSSVGDERCKSHSELFSSVLTKPVKQSLLFKSILAQLGNDQYALAVEAPVKQKLHSDFSQRYPLNILIAEDNPVNQKLAERVLSKLGYKPEIATNGKEVLETLGLKYYDLILMDVQMPEMDGLEATRKIRQENQQQPVIIAVTANAMQGDKEECLRAGMDDYISKPIKLEDLIKLLEKWAVKMFKKSA